MKNKIYIGLVIIVVFLAALFIARFSSPEDTWLCVNGQWVKHGTPSSPAPTTGCGNSPVEKPFSQSISDSLLTLRYTSDFGLATNDTQILVKSYIPPCDSGFLYCIYYIGTEYNGTIFESAGVRYQRRTDLTSEQKCLNTEPVGYAPDSLVQKTSTSSDYTTSKFGPIGDAGAGHYATGELYRLFYGNKCYELETRIGETQFANYLPGAIKEFTSADRTSVQKELRRIVDNLTINSTGKTVIFPLGSPATETVSQSVINFDQIGHFVKNNPGLKPSVWYLVYEKPGSPAITTELSFTPMSICEYNGKTGICPDVLLPSSALTRVQGYMDNGIVSVISAISGN